MYKISRYLYPLIKLMGKNASVESTELAKALFAIGQTGYQHKVLENIDIKTFNAVETPFYDEKNNCLFHCYSIVARR